MSVHIKKERARNSLKKICDSKFNIISVYLKIEIDYMYRKKWER